MAQPAEQPRGDVALRRLRRRQRLRGDGERARRHEQQRIECELQPVFELDQRARALAPIPSAASPTVRQHTGSRRCRRARRTARGKSVRVPRSLGVLPPAPAASQRERGSPRRHARPRAGSTTCARQVSSNCIRVGIDDDGVELRIEACPAFAPVDAQRRRRVRQREAKTAAPRRRSARSPARRRAFAQARQTRRASFRKAG